MATDPPNEHSNHTDVNIPLVEFSQALLIQPSTEVNPTFLAWVVVNTDNTVFISLSSPDLQLVEDVKKLLMRQNIDTISKIIDVPKIYHTSLL